MRGCVHANSFDDRFVKMSFPRLRRFAVTPPPIGVPSDLGVVIGVATG